MTGRQLQAIAEMPAIGLEVVYRLAAAMLLGLNGLRCGELIACNVEDVGNHSWHTP